MEWKTKLRSKTFWLTTTSAVLVILQAAGVHIISEQYNTIINALLGVAVVSGIVIDHKE